MWQTGDDVMTCDMADDVDVLFHMLSHKASGTIIKKQNSQRDQTQKVIEKLHLLPSFPLLHHLQHIFIKFHRKPKKTLKFINRH